MTEREARHEVRNRLAVVRLAETILRSETVTDQQKERAREMLSDSLAAIEQVRPFLNDEDRATLGV